MNSRVPGTSTDANIPLRTENLNTPRALRPGFSLRHRHDTFVSPVFKGTLISCPFPDVSRPQGAAEPRWELPLMSRISSTELLAASPSQSEPSARLPELLIANMAHPACETQRTQTDTTSKIEPQLALDTEAQRAHFQFQMKKWEKCHCTALD